MIQVENFKWIHTDRFLESKLKAHGNTKDSKRVKRHMERGAKKKANLFKNRFRSGGEENERRMENNVLRVMRVHNGLDLLGNNARNSSCYLLSLHWFFP